MNKITLILGAITLTASTASMASSALPAYGIKGNTGTDPGSIPFTISNGKQVTIVNGNVSGANITIGTTAQTTYNSPIQVTLSLPNNAKASTVIDMTAGVKNMSDASAHGQIYIEAFDNQTDCQNSATKGSGDIYKMVCTEINKSGHYYLIGGGY